MANEFHGPVSNRKVNKMKFDCVDKPVTKYGRKYLSWKEWDLDAFAVLDKHKETDFFANVKKSKTDFPLNSQVLEIGFGNGSFLAYGSKRGWKMYGTEVNMELVERAKQKGYQAFLTPNLVSFPNKHFNLVVAFDVLEHLPENELFDFLLEIKRVLQDNGIFIARFPNGDSPFARFLQYGDSSHVTIIGSLKAKYYAKMLGVNLVYIGAEAQPILAGWTYFAHRIVAVPVKYLMNLFLNFIFRPRDHVVFTSPNLVLVFKVKKPATAV
jgi:SAM-dependent methyltransferase